jgi:hypothetical protein
MKKIKTIIRWINNDPLLPSEQNFIDDVLLNIKIVGIISVFLVILLYVLSALDIFTEHKY